MPPVAMALSTPWIPNGAKPPWEGWTKLVVWKDRIIMTMTARKGMAIFHTMFTLLDFARLATPSRFMTVNTAMSTTEITMPIGVRTVTPPEVLVSQGK